MNVLGLFSVIGGFELGFQRAGFNIVAMCEIEPYARAVLRKNFPGVPIFDDVRTLTGEQLRAFKIDVITGGFPCQDISLAGKGAGITGARSGLWVEMFRVISEVRPSWVVVENVSALRSRGLDSVLGALASIGYDAEWHCIPASSCGAPHKRERLWVVAYPVRVSESEPGYEGQAVSHQRHARMEPGGGSTRQPVSRAEPPMADTNGAVAQERSQPQLLVQFAPSSGSGWWAVEPNVGRVAHGIPRRVDRLKGLGNAVVPQIPEMIARAIRDLCAT